MDILPGNKPKCQTGTEVLLREVNNLDQIILFGHEYCVQMSSCDGITVKGWLRVAGVLLIASIFG